MKPLASTLLGIGLVVLLGLAIVGVWQKPEQTRPLSYEKGVYGGPADSTLDSSTVDELRHRMQRYRNSGY